MAGERGETFRKLYIPPIFGFPKKRDVDFPPDIPSNIWLVRLDNQNNEVESLKIQTVPLELRVDPIPDWAVIPSIGRNNPFYHYTGGEDSVSFTIDWYSIDQRKRDVIEKCRWVESLSKANAYRNEPPRVLLIFGDLFKYRTWIVKSAPYRLSMFDKEMGMMPCQAYQDLTLSLVTEQNTDWAYIRENA